MTGFYLALEGAEGAGKSAVAGEVGRVLERRRIEVVRVREPGGTDLGEEVRRLLLHAGELAPWAEAALFAAQRAQLAVEVIGPALERGAWVVSDRSYYSSLAYQGVARGLGPERVRALNETVLGEVVPDLVVLLDVDPELGLGRQRETDRIGGSGVELQRMVVDAYRKLAADEPERVVAVDAGRPIEAVAAEVVDLAEARWRS